MTKSRATEQIYKIICELDGPRDAAMALAGAHIMLLLREGVDTEEEARARIDASSKETLRVWREEIGLPAQQ